MECLSSARSALCKISYSSAAAAALTSSDCIRPAQRQRDQLIAALATRGRSPRPSPPSTSTTPRRGSRARRRQRVASATGAVAPASRLARRDQEVGEVAHARDPQVLDRAGRGLARRRASPRPRGARGSRRRWPRRTRRCGRSRRGSADPGPRPAPPRAALTGQQLARRTRTGTRRPRAHALVRGRAAAALDLLGRAAPARARPAATARARRRAVAHTSPTLVARRPRSASRTALRP